MATPMLSVEGVSHSYGTRRALDNVTFAVAPATFSVMLGLNGAGKSTLFALITRLYGTQHGRIRILDFDVSQVSSEALRILGVVFQSRTLDLDLTIMVPPGSENAGRLRPRTDPGQSRCRVLGHVLGHSAKRAKKGASSRTLFHLMAEGVDAIKCTKLLN